MKHGDGSKEEHDDFPVFSHQDDKPIDLSARFASGKELATLRSDIASLRETLHWAKAMKDSRRCSDLEKAIQEGEAMDPEIVYKNALEEAKAAKTSVRLSQEKKEFLIKHWENEANAARACLPRFQLQGLWVGK